jgi:hypothetical protein
MKTEDLVEINNFLRSRKMDSYFQNYIKELKIKNMNIAVKQKQLEDFLTHLYINLVRPSLIPAIARQLLI